MFKWDRSWLGSEPRSLAHLTFSKFKNFSDYLAGRFPYILIICAISSGIATFIALSNTDQLASSPQIVLILINVDLILLLLLALFVSRKLLEIWVARRRGLAGSRLHVKLVMLFSFLAVMPAILVSIFSVLFFNFGLQSWFSERVEKALNNSLAVADAYLKEHRKLIRSDVVSIGREFMQDISLLRMKMQNASVKLTDLTRLRSVPEAVIFDTNHQILARSHLTFTLEFEMIPQWAVERALNGDVVVLANESGDRVRALVLLDRNQGILLYIGRFVDPTVLNHRYETLSAVSEYNLLKGKQSQIEIRFALIFALVAVLLLLGAIWIGLTFATQLTRPIRRLVVASEKIRQGDLKVRVEEDTAEEELLSLSRAFNRMATQLEQQRDDLVQANHQLDARRQFTESVLDGVSAGVIGLDEKGHINLPNQSASHLLEIPLGDIVKRPLVHVVPEMAELFAQAQQGGGRTYEGQVILSRANAPKTLFVRFVVERSENKVIGYVVTFDDMTALVSAQRKAAWSDVARRIAHEIKNPLTPIQLSAERLQRKYKDEVTSDPEIFKTCTETIIRQVEDIGRMVDEFSAFARMPAPNMSMENLTEIAEQALFLQKNAHNHVSFVFESKNRSVSLNCDRRLVSQALTNLLQNALDSVYTAMNETGQKKGEIRLMIDDGSGIRIVVEDTGKGLPLNLMDSLAEPYVTTKAKGTGLGLAIVKKIMEDHGGNLILENRLEGGARVILAFQSNGIQQGE
jgi:two-component system nitrogen regulation sensor histidine kinase NtrY